MSAPAAPKPSDCTACREHGMPAGRFYARGAAWCSLCDRQTPESLAERVDVTTKRTKEGRE